MAENVQARCETEGGGGGVGEIDAGGNMSFTLTDDDSACANDIVKHTRSNSNNSTNVRMLKTNDNIPATKIIPETFSPISYAEESSSDPRCGWSSQNAYDESASNEHFDLLSSRKPHRTSNTTSTTSQFKNYKQFVISKDSIGQQEENKQKTRVAGTTSGMISQTSSMMPIKSSSGGLIPLESSSSKIATQTYGDTTTSNHSNSLPSATTLLASEQTTIFTQQQVPYSLDPQTRNNDCGIPPKQYVNQLESTIGVLKQRISLLSKENSELKQQKNRFVSQQKEIETMKQAIEQENREMRSNHASATARWEAAIQKERDHVRELEQVIQKQSIDTAQLKSSYSQLERENKQLQQELLKNKAETFQKYEDLKQNHEDLLEAYEEKFSCQLKLITDDYATRISALENRQITEDAFVQSLRMQAATDAKRISDLQATNEHLRDNLETITQQNLQFKNISKFLDSQQQQYLAALAQNINPQLLMIDPQQTNKKVIIKSKSKADIKSPRGGPGEQQSKHPSESEGLSNRQTTPLRKLLSESKFINEQTTIEEISSSDQQADESMTTQSQKIQQNQFQLQLSAAQRISSSNAQLDNQYSQSTQTTKRNHYLQSNISHRHYPSSISSSNALTNPNKTYIEPKQTQPTPERNVEEQPAVALLLNNQTCIDQFKPSKLQQHQQQEQQNQPQQQQQQQQSQPRSTLFQHETIKYLLAPLSSSNTQNDEQSHHSSSAAAASSMISQVLLNTTKSSKNPQKQIIAKKKKSKNSQASNDQHSFYNTINSSTINQTLSFASLQKVPSESIQKSKSVMKPRPIVPSSLLLSENINEQNVHQDPNQQQQQLQYEPIPSTNKYPSTKGFFSQKPHSNPMNISVSFLNKIVNEPSIVKMNFPSTHSSQQQLPSQTGSSSSSSSLRNQNPPKQILNLSVLPQNSSKFFEQHQQQPQTIQQQSAVKMNKSVIQDMDNQDIFSPRTLTNRSNHVTSIQQQQLSSDASGKRQRNNISNSSKKSRIEPHALQSILMQNISSPELSDSQRSSKDRFTDRSMHNSKPSTMNKSTSIKMNVFQKIQQQIHQQQTMKEQ